MSQIEKIRHAMLLLEGKKHSPKEICRIVGVSVSTVYTLISKLKHNCSYNRKIGSGRPPKTLPLIANSVAQQIRRKPWISLRAIAQKCPVTTSKNTVARCLKKLDYTKPYPISVPLLSETNRLKRIQWAQEHIDKDWQHAIFADEASIWVSRGRIRMWTKGDSVRHTTTVKHTQKINIWTGFSSMGTFPLCIFDENLTAVLFVKILEEHLLEQAKVFHQDEWFIVQDNDPKHTAKHTKAWMEQFMDKNRIDWPSQSPDLNPIENLFAWIKLELIKRKPKTKKELIVELTNVWAGIDGFFLHSYWNSMPKRCNLVLENNDYKIKY